MDTQTQIERLIELAIVQRTELKQLVEQLPQLRDHLTSEVEKTFEEAEPQLRSELEEFCEKRATDANAKVGTALEARIASLAADLQLSTQARFDALKEQERKLEALRADAKQEIAAQVATMPDAVKEIVTAELARFPRAGEIDQLRKEFAEPRGLNPRGKWLPDETYNKLDLVTFNGDSYVSNIDDNKERPTRTAANWTLNAARGASGGGGGITSLNDVLNAPTAGQIVGSQNGQYVPKTLVAGANITINETASAITIIGDEGEISLQDGTAAAPALFFTNDTDTGIYRPAANTLGISVSGTQIAYFDANGLTVPSAGVVAGGSFHGANGNANNPSLSFSGDQDTGFFRHQSNELGITLGGVQKATLTSTTFSITPNLVVSGTGSINGTSIPASKTLVVTTDKLSALASTSSSELAGVISDETGTGALVFANTPTLVTPNIGAATGTSVNLSGNATVGGTLTTSGKLTVSTTAGQEGMLVTGVSGEWTGRIQANTTSGSSYGLLVRGGTNTSDKALSVYNAGGTSELVQVRGDGLTTLSGNLTVSGTGTSSVAGNLGVGTASPAYRLDILDNSSGIQLRQSSSSTSGTTHSFVNSATNGRSWRIGNNFVTGVGEFAIYDDTAAACRAFFTAGGNVIFGDTTDSSNGKLQLATHTTSAGGIGFGTDVSLFRPAAGFLQLEGATFAGLKLKDAGAGAANYIVSDNGALYIGVTDTPSAGNDALSIDTSKNATFAGTVTVNGGEGIFDGGTGKGRITLAATVAGGTNIIHSTTTAFGSYTPLAICPNGGNLLIGTTADRNSRLYSVVTDGTYSLGLSGTTKGIRVVHNSTLSSIEGVDNTLNASYQTLQLNGSSLQFATNGGTTALTLDSSQRCILAGALRLNNAYTAGAPTATGYVTLQDSAGNTYKVLVST